MHYRKKPGVRVVAGLMAAVPVCKYQKAERKDKKLLIIKWWRLEWERITVSWWDGRHSSLRKGRAGGMAVQALQSVRKGGESVKTGVGE